MAEEQNRPKFGPDPRFLPEWVRDQVEAWLVEELAAHPGDPDGATAGVMTRVENDPRIVRAVSEAFSRGLLLEMRLRQDLAPPERVTPLVAELDRVREELAGGRDFPCAAEVLRELREEQEARR